ncbi:hypothetical protein MFLO_13992 [Listeria floridensis FSL S10-1187]|uniref:Secreted protein n=1 Tax=Listeria floridensis FSL S10-1187 TaxID=1265817 RepID=A0ABN0RC52_9LIST|nr:hypothetical protein [Listeria floridensis]EUJ26481.1 hypothetical protein MFLO_13992 [Listeria floridensis FSL S10-1187]
MRKIPVFTLIAILLLGGGYFYYQHVSSKVDITFNFNVTKVNAEKNTISGTIDGAGDTVVTLPVTKDILSSVKKGSHYNIEATFYNKKQVAEKTEKKLEGPFWSNENNKGLLANKVKVENLESITNQ